MLIRKRLGIGNLEREIWKRGRLLVRGVLENRYQRGALVRRFERKIVKESKEFM